MVPASGLEIAGPMRKTNASETEIMSGDLGNFGRRIRSEPLIPQSGANLIGLASPAELVRSV